MFREFFWIVTKILALIGACQTVLWIKIWHDRRQHRKHIDEYMNRLNHFRDALMKKIGDVKTK